MDARLKLLLKKTRSFQLLFVAVAVVCLLVFLVLNFSLNDRYGAFAEREAKQEIEIPLMRDALTDIAIDASDVKLEIGMVSGLAKPRVILSGTGYSDQLAKVDVEGTSCTIALQNSSIDADASNLTMLLLLPQNDYQSITINGTNLNLHIDDVRTSILQADVQGEGYAYFTSVKADSMTVTADDTPLRFYNNQVAVLDVMGGYATVTLLENNFERLQLQTVNGNIFGYERKFSGQWNLQSDYGDITVITKNLPYNMTIQAAASEFDLGYDSRYWKKSEINNVDGLNVVSVGNSPDKILLAQTSGKMSVSQRERYSDLDPYADDYPYAQTNPYLIERSTITK